MTPIEFLTTLFGDNSGFLFISTLDDEGELVNHKPFQYPEALRAVEGYLSSRSDEDVWFSPMLYKIPRRKASVVSSTPVLYADTDMFDPAGYRIAPSINVETSKGRVASFWLLDDEYKPADVAEVAKAIAHTHASKVNGKQAGVDPSGWDLTQLLRMPGSTNNKYREEKYRADGYEEPYPVFVRSDSPGEIYSLAEVSEAYPYQGLAREAETIDSEMPTDLPESKDVIGKLRKNYMLADMYDNPPRAGQDWSDTMYRFLSECFREGFTPEEALVAGWYAACNKYKRDGRPMSDLWEYDVSNAYADPDNRAIETVGREAVDIEVSSSAVELVLIRDDEQQYRTRTFVDDYADWGASRTDAPVAYHVASAFTLMSTILGEWGVLQPQFGTVRLGFFFVIMGETTDTRKSTSRNLMKDVLRMTQVADYEYILTSDTTPEALLDALAERANQSTLYDRDEAQQLIEDIKGGKSYLKGFFETLNELYDGKAHGRLRSTKKTAEAPVNFVQYLMGIRSQIQDNLEHKDFASGWGPRNIFVRGEAAPRTRENARLKQGNRNGDKGPDRKKMELVMALTDARDFWARKAGGDRAYPYTMYFEDDAWERMTDLEWDLKEYFSKHPRYEIIKPCIERLTINVMKAAVLFAMMNKRDEANMEDVVNARYYAAQWVEDLVVVIEGVNESMDQRMLDKIEKFLLDNDGLVTYAKLLKWSTSQGIKKKDFIDYLDTLVQTDVARVVDDVKKKKSVELMYV